jgi:hypothetical protein
MARYPIFDGVPEDIDVITGFDHQYPGFFLMIESFRGRKQGDPENYLFHNIEDHPGVVMTISQIEETLKRFDIPITRDDVERLVRDAEKHRFEQSIIDAPRLIPGTIEAELEDFRATKRRYGLA